MRLRWLSTEKSERGTNAFSLSLLLWRMLGALVLGVMLARWSWVLFAPNASAVAVELEHGATVEAAKLFGTAVVSAVSPSEGMALPNVHLVGIFAARAGKPGFAVLKLDEKKQVGVVAGENVVPGTRLLEVHPNYVLLERAGVQQKVNLEEKAVASGIISVTPNSVTSAEQAIALQRKALEMMMRRASGVNAAPAVDN